MPLLLDLGRQLGSHMWEETWMGSWEIASWPQVPPHSACLWALVRAGEGWVWGARCIPTAHSAPPSLPLPCPSEASVSYAEDPLQ